MAGQAKGKKIRNVEDALKTYEKYHVDINKKINTKDSAEENFKLFGKFLIDEGFSFTTKDLDFLTLTTSEKTSKGGYKYVLSISFKDNQIIIRPKCNTLLFTGSVPFISSTT